MFFRHPDDEPSPRFGSWADDFNTYEDACRFYGAPTPADIAAEIAAEDAEALLLCLDDIEARGGPFYYFPGTDEIPF